MGFRIERRRRWFRSELWEYEAYNSAYGYIGSYANSKAEAVVKLSIAEAELYENPYPPDVVKKMLANPEHYAAYYPDPESEEVRKEMLPGD